MSNAKLDLYTVVFQIRTSTYILVSILHTISPVLVEGVLQKPIKKQATKRELKLDKSQKCYMQKWTCHPKSMSSWNSNELATLLTLPCVRTQRTLLKTVGAQFRLTPSLNNWGGPRISFLIWKLDNRENIPVYIEKSSWRFSCSCNARVYDDYLSVASYLECLINEQKTVHCLVTLLKSLRKVKSLIPWASPKRTKGSVLSDELAKSLKTVVLQCLAHNLTRFITM